MSLADVIEVLPTTDEDSSGEQGCAKAGRKRPRAESGQSIGQFRPDPHVIYGNAHVAAEPSGRVSWQQLWDVLPLTSHALIASFVLDFEFAVLPICRQADLALTLVYHQEEARRGSQARVRPALPVRDLAHELGHETPIAALLRTDTVCVVGPRLLSNYSTFHAKCVLLRHRKERHGSAQEWLRLAITSANATHGDWHAYEQCVWCIDLPVTGAPPPRSQRSAGAMPDAPEYLLRTLQAWGVPAARASQLLAGVSWADMPADLVGTIPQCLGRAGTAASASSSATQVDLCQPAMNGQWRLAALRAIPLPPSAREYPPTASIRWFASSVGSFRAGTGLSLATIANACAGESLLGHAEGEPVPPVRLLWPSAGCAERGLFGLPGTGCVRLAPRTAQHPDFPLGALRRWAPRCPDAYVMSHAKLLVPWPSDAAPGNPLASPQDTPMATLMGELEPACDAQGRALLPWVYAGSANASCAAQGVPTRSGGLRCNNYELGVYLQHAAVQLPNVHVGTGLCFVDSRQADPPMSGPAHLTPFMQ